MVEKVVQENFGLVMVRLSLVEMLISIKHKLPLINGLRVEISHIKDKLVELVLKLVL